ncbi:MAG: hypothetical protein ACOVQ7_04120 [Limnoraphis robusta]
MITTTQPKFVQVSPTVMLLCLTPLLFGCNQLATSTAKLSLNVTPIEKLEKRKAEAKVYIKGTVESHAPFVGAAAYQLQDNTGEVWVFTTERLPELGQEILVRGKVSYESITLKELPEQDIGGVYLKELERIQEPSPENSDKETKPPIPPSEPVVEEKE